MTKRIRILLMAAFSIFILTGTVAAYNSSGTKMVKIINDDKENYYNTAADTVEELLKEANIEVTNDDIVVPPLSSEIKNGEEVKIRRAMTVTFAYGSQTKTVKTTVDKVGDIFNEYKYLFGEKYELESPSASTHLSNNMTIKVKAEESRIDTRTDKIDFETKYVDDPTLDKGVKKTVQDGTRGTVEIKTKFTYYGDQLLGSEEVSRTVVKKPVDEIINVGTKEKAVVKTVSQSSQAIAGYNYKGTISMVSTAYTPHDAGCNSVTSTGAVAQKGVVAIDPSVIPYGTKLYIPGYGVAVAADCGGAIKGNRIDLCYSTLNEAYQWGRKNVTVYILE
ncbi:MAG: 3D domain-containing protein [Clostridia bacterium]|jgi:uncharacterized protein YabE (DUF348 family)|nr:3D domain-containing protein [Clostridia bacterium]